MSNKESNIEKTNFDGFIQAVGSEIEQAQVRLIVAANAQMLFHHWKIGNYTSRLDTKKRPSVRMAFSS